MTRPVFRRLVEFFVKSSFFFQEEGSDMGLPRGPSSANSFMCLSEPHCTASFQSLFWKRYVSDVFLLFRNLSNSLMFLNYVSINYPNINFCIGYEANKKLNPLHCSASWKNNKFVTYFTGSLHSPLYVYVISLLVFFVLKEILLKLYYTVLIIYHLTS